MADGTHAQAHVTALGELLEVEPPSSFGPQPEQDQAIDHWHDSCRQSILGCLTIESSDFKGGLGSSFQGRRVA